VIQNFSRHEDYRDEESTETGTDRAFGRTVGTILTVIAEAKSFCRLMFIPRYGRCTVIGWSSWPLALGHDKQIWLKRGDLIVKVVNSALLALLFFFVVTPTALVMRMAGKRPLRLAPDQTAGSYWIERARPEGGASSMRRQF